MQKKGAFDDLTRAANNGASPRHSNGPYIARAISSLSDLAVADQVSARDAMFDGGLNAYLNTGLTALRAILATLDLKSMDHGQVHSILDFGSGHGRVTRALRAYWPQSEICAHDVLTDAVDFCVQTFDCTPSYAPEDINQTELPSAAYDLIFCGSIFSHLDVKEFHGTLQKLALALRPGGVLVFTTAGHYVANLARDGFHGGVRPNTVRSMLDSFEVNGFGFGLYTGQEARRWGWAFAAPWWVARAVQAADLQLLNYMERGWGGRQDLIAVHAWSS